MCLLRKKNVVISTNIAFPLICTHMIQIISIQVPYTTCKKGESFQQKKSCLHNQLNRSFIPNFLVKR